MPNAIAGPRVAPPRLDVERRTDGAIVLRSPDPLRPFARAVGEWLVQWASLAPDRCFLAQRGGDEWRRVTYAEALDAVYRLGASLLARGERPGLRWPCRRGFQDSVGDVGVCRFAAREPHRRMQAADSRRGHHRSRPIRGGSARVGQSCGRAVARLDEPAIRAQLQLALAALRRRSLGGSSVPARLLVLDLAPSIDEGEITDKGYINQRAVLDRRAMQVEHLHAGGPGVIWAE